MNATLTHLNRVPSTSRTDSCLVSNLCQKDPAFRVVEAMFDSGWDGKAGPKIEKILKINHNIGVLKRFEEYMEITKSKSANISRKLAVDGNELLRFHGATVTCSLGNNELSRICSKESCGVCRMVRLVGSAGEESVASSNDSRRAHRRVTKECGVNNKIYIGKPLLFAE
ncbi:Ribonuclease P family protein, putative isoform 1 [Hibiscus syriacus]|uniref:Ribonuclease P family protein, putative isoform 1 n=2 Tax=Hibiscus syriacus TaxID=106335 RepID=A0A6A2YEV6_HIBSY|nr:Ribonuclease P family protein, putative isoform 1 [Hibiscus syriacus]